MTMSTVPAAMPSMAALVCLPLLKRDSSASLIGQLAKRSLKVWKCCSASSVVGVSTATWRPPAAAMKAARKATSVLPKPTSPHTSRSIGRDGNQVLHDRMDGGDLVGRLLEAEAFDEGLVVGGVEAEWMAFASSAPGIEVEQFGRGVARLLGRLAARLFPLPGAERVQRRALRRGAGIAADLVQLRHRHVERRVAGVGEMQELGHALAEVEVDQALVAADAVLRMHDRIARLEFRQVADQAVDLRGLAAAARVRCGARSPERARFR